MSDTELVQGTDQWLKARCGSLGASRMSDAIAKTKTGWGASRANLMAELLVERFTGLPAEKFTNDAMRWGIEYEPEARAAYEAAKNYEVLQIGIVKHPLIAWTHASPDGLVGDHGLVEIKCPTSATHIDTLLGKSVPGKYITQIQWQLACTGRGWCDFVSYDPRMPENMRLFVKRITRDADRCAELADLATDFLAELDDKLARLTSLYEREAA